MNPTYNTIVVNDESTELTLLGAPSCVMLIVAHHLVAQNWMKTSAARTPYNFFLGVKTSISTVDFPKKNPMDSPYFVVSLTFEELLTP